MELPVDKDGKVRHYRKLDEKLQVVKEAFYKGAPVYIKSGRHSGLKGSVVGRNGQDSLLIRLSNEERVSVLFSEESNWTIEMSSSVDDRLKKKNAKPG